MAKKKKVYKVGLDSETYAISLVEFPAIEETLVALEEQKEIKVQLADESKHMVYSAVLVPDRPIYRRNEDGDEFYVEFTKESIEHMSQQFFKEYKQNEVTIDHETTASDITVVESWIKADLYKDKSVALGLNEELPCGTWFAGMKVNQIDAWNRIVEGSLQGFSVESMLRLEEFEKQNNIDMIETNDMFWDKLKNILKDVFSSTSMSKDGEIEPVNDIDLSSNSGVTNDPHFAERETEIIMEELEDATPAPEPTPEPAPEPAPVVEPAPEPKPAPEPEPVAEEPKVNPLEDLVKNLTDEVKALKQINEGLQEKIKDLGKQPSAAPVNTNATKPIQGEGGVNGSTYAQWRQQMKQWV